MSKRAWWAGIALAACLAAGAQAETGAPLKSAQFAEQRMQWLGQSAFEIKDSVTVATDPFQLKRPAKADLVLITHPHFDHFSPDDIAKVRRSGTVIVAPDDPEIRAKLGGEVRYVKPGDRLNVKGIAIEAVPAYNLSKEFHPKAKQWVGYVITVDGVRIYDAGDTDRIPEMKDIQADIALLPVGGKYTMDAKEAAAAARDLAPKLAIPMHYGKAAGSVKDAEAFQAELQGRIPVLIKKAE